MTDDTESILWLAVEDYSGLWEAVWELRANHADMDSEVLLGRAKDELIRLVGHDLIQLYRCLEPYGDMTDVEKQEAVDLLRMDANWNEPEPGSVSIRFGATPAGRAAAGVPEL
ncbi:hypothetical protein [Microlunatus parietis]|uniref:Uncharacterized protein n=1 Tax=Microlunatus parietis TaxID=682979 RepID=A0A7Y9ID05_9ACTN|nr:hypothetical protein [Microlunatus parietis]NYE74681.1 hypothetical protein [Microlunatus parietis]